MNFSRHVKKVVNTVAKTPVTRKRVTVSKVNGRLSLDSTSMEVIYCSVQTPSYREMQLLPEGMKTKTLKKFISTSEIHAEDEVTGSPADHLIMTDGREFKVFQLLSSEFGVYKAIGVKQ